jgi:hypothetical protein
MSSANCSVRVLLLVRMVKRTRRFWRDCKPAVCLILCLTFASCGSRQTSLDVVQSRENVLAGRFEIPENGGYQIPQTFRGFEDGVSDDQSLRILDSRRLSDGRMIVLLLMNIDRGPFTSYSLTNVVLYRKSGDGDWTELAERGWGDGANSGVKSFEVNNEGSVLALDVLVAGGSGERSDLVGYQRVTYEIGQASFTETDKGPVIGLGPEEWPLDWAGGVTGPCPIAERVNKADPDGRCVLPLARTMTR